MKIPKLHLSTRTEFGNNDFQNQRTQASKNTYVAKIRQKFLWVSHFGFLCTRPEYTRAKSENYRIIITQSNFCGKIVYIYLSGYPSNGKLEIKCFLS